MTHCVIDSFRIASFQVAFTGFSCKQTKRYGPVSHVWRHSRMPRLGIAL
jgi:hypothetical protein